MDILLILIAGFLMGILMVLAAERNMHSQPPPHHPNGGQHITPHHDLGFSQYPFDPYYYEYLRRQQNQNFWGLLLTIIFTIVLILLLLYD